MHDELFNEKGVFTHAGTWNLPTTCMHEWDAAPGEFLVQAECVLKDPRVRKVVLVRENRLAVAVSKLCAASTGTYHFPLILGSSSQSSVTVPLRIVQYCIHFHCLKTVPQHGFCVRENEAEERMEKWVSLQLKKVIVCRFIHKVASE